MISIILQAADTVSSIFAPVSTPAAKEADLARFVLVLSAVVFVVVGGLIAYSVVRFRARAGDQRPEPPQVYGSAQVEAAWTAVPLIIILVLMLATGRVIHEIQAAPQPPNALEVTVVGKQWWWEIRYPKLGIVTANELHVPVSDSLTRRPTFLTLESADVAHSFWVPRVAGKTDLIPNRTTRMWVEPHEPGTYLGQCAEYCGTQHTLMLLRIVAEPPEAVRPVAAAAAPGGGRGAGGPGCRRRSPHIPRHGVRELPRGGRDEREWPVRAGSHPSHVPGNHRSRRRAQHPGTASRLGPEPGRPQARRADAGHGRSTTSISISSSSISSLCAERAHHDDDPVPGCRPRRRRSRLPSSIGFGSGA